MTSNALDYSMLFNKDLPAPPAQWEGHPKYNFIGGHSDPDSVPLEGFIEAAANVFSGDPRYISMYSFDGPQGILPLRQFVVDKLRTHRGIEITVDEVLITSGSGQGIQIINDVLLEEGDTVIIEEFSFSGALNFLRRRNVNFVAVKIDDDGIRMDHLEEILEDLPGQGHPAQVHLHNPNPAKSQRLCDEHGAPSSDARAKRRVRSPDLRGRMLRRPRIRGRVRACNQGAGRHKQGAAHRLILKEPWPSHCASGTWSPRGRY